VTCVSSCELHSLTNEVVPPFGVVNQAADATRGSMIKHVTRNGTAPQRERCRNEIRHVFPN